MKSNGPRPGRLPSLDGLRGVAALVVVAHHCLLVVPVISAMHYPGPRPVSSVDWLVFSPLHGLWAGGEAVWVFFVLSGLVLTRSVVSRPNPNWRAFYPSRLVRLYLPVIAAVAFSVVIALLVRRSFPSGFSRWMAMHVDPVSGKEIGLDVTLLGGPGSALNSALWSLRWEVLFSVLLPVFVWLVLKVDNRVLLGLSAASATVGELVMGEEPSRVSTALGGCLLYLPIFMVGCVLARHLDALQATADRVAEGRNATAVWIGLALVSALALTATWTAGRHLYASGSEGWAPVTLLGATLLVLLAIGAPLFRRVLEVGAVQWLGRISFSLYLTHEPIVVSTGLLLPESERWATVLIAPPVALLIGWGFYRLVEAPSHRLATRLARSVGARGLRVAPEPG